MKKIILAVLLTASFISVKAQKTFDIVNAGTFSSKESGIATDKRKNIYGSGYNGDPSAIGRINFKGKHSLFHKFGEGSRVAAIVVDAEDAMYVADAGHKKIYMKGRKDDTFRDIVDCSPIDSICQMVISLKNGVFYVADSDFEANRSKIWMVVRDSDGGEVEVVADALPAIGGLEISPDGRRLYVGERENGVVWIYDILDSGRLDNKRVFRTFPGSGIAGITSDTYGNLFIARKDIGRIIVTTSGGVILKEVTTFGKKPAEMSVNMNDTVCFIYMPDRKTIEYVQLVDIFGEPKYM